MITGLFMGWTDPCTKQWFPITKMTWKILLDRSPGYIKDIAAHYPQAIKLTMAKISYLYSRERILCHARIDSKVTTPFTDAHYQPLVDLLVGIK
jgi:hypothetical protein